MVRLTVELPDDLGKYVEFIPQSELNAMFTDMLQQRVSGNTSPAVTIVQQSVQESISFDEEKFFARLENVLASKVVTSPTSAPIKPEVIKEKFKVAVASATSDDPITPATGDEVMDNFMSELFK